MAPFKADLSQGSSQPLAGKKREATRQPESATGRPVPQFVSAPDHAEAGSPPASSADGTMQEKTDPPPAKKLKPAAERKRKTEQKPPSGDKRKVMSHKKTKQDDGTEVCGGTQTGEHLSPRNKENASLENVDGNTIQMLEADRLTDDMVAAIQGAVEFCLAIQFQSGSTSFKCKSSLTQSLATPRYLLIRAQSKAQAVTHFQVDLRQVDAFLGDFLLQEILFKAGVRKIAFDAKILIKMLLRSLSFFPMERLSGELFLFLLYIIM
jgi:hypothetical protein